MAAIQSVSPSRSASIDARASSYCAFRFVMSGESTLPSTGMLSEESLRRLLQRPWFGRKVARLPDHGTLLFATDLQGNYGDFRALADVYRAEDAAGNEPILAFCGDLV